MDTITATVTAPGELYSVGDDGNARVNFHAGQLRAWDSTARFVAVFAGTRGGKTAFGPWWLWREIQRRGPGTYLVAAPSFPLLDQAAAPEIQEVFGRVLGLGKMNRSPRWQFVFNDKGKRDAWGKATKDRTRIIFGHAAAPDALEGFGAKAAWLDECGQKGFKLGSWHAIIRRMAIGQSRALLTTTPYNLGWVKQQVFDCAKRRGTKDERPGDKDYEVVNFESRMNPQFPAAEWERAKATLPAWKFNMFYRGIFERPAGLIYDSFDLTEHTTPPFTLPDSWPRFLGLDFGGVHTAGMFYAQEPETKKLYGYREYLAGGRTAKEHVAALKAGEPMLPVAVGGSHSEGQWRDEFRAAGLPVREPAVKDVEVGIGRVYAAHKTGQIIVFDNLSGYLDEKASYSRPLDDNGEPTEGIEDKETFHRLDAERYIIGWIRRRELTGRESYTAGPAMQFPQF